VARPERDGEAEDEQPRAHHCWYRAVERAQLLERNRG